MGSKNNNRKSDRNSSTTRCLSDVSCTVLSQEVHWATIRWSSTPRRSLSSQIHSENTGATDFSVRGQAPVLPGRGQDAPLILGGAGLENKHAAVPKPFHILKRRQSTNLWIGRPGTPVTNVISAWHRGFKPIQPPTHRPLLRLCHHNPQAGFLLPRWAGDSMCEQNSSARAARRNYYLFLAWQ